MSNKYKEILIIILKVIVIVYSILTSVNYILSNDRTINLNPTTYTYLNLDSQIKIDKNSKDIPLEISQTTFFGNFLNINLNSLNVRVSNLNPENTTFILKLDSCIDSSSSNLNLNFINDTIKEFEVNGYSKRSFKIKIDENLSKKFLSKYNKCIFELQDKSNSNIVVFRKKIQVFI